MMRVNKSVARNATAPVEVDSKMHTIDITPKYMIAALRWMGMCWRRRDVLQKGECVEEGGMC